jgi:glycosyltransferase involved in cell wall biosynthesis
MKPNRLLFFVVNPHSNNGAENWRAILVSELKRKMPLREIHTTSLSSLFNELRSCNVIHTYGAYPFGIIGTIIAKILGKKIVHTVHGDYYEEHQNKSGIKYLLWLPLNIFHTRIADIVTFPSDHIKKRICAKLPEITHKSTVVHNGIDVSPIQKIKTASRKDLPINTKDKVILQLSNFNRIQKAQGNDLLIKHFKAYREKHPHTHLFILGAGKFLNQYKETYKNEQNVHFLGLRADAVSLMKTADLVTFYSFLDNFPIAILEAMACGKKVLSTRTGGIPEMLPDACLTDGPIIMEGNGPEAYKTNLKALEIKNIASQFIKIYET